VQGLQVELIAPPVGSAERPGERFIASRDQLATILGLAPVTVNKLANEGMPRASHGRYDVAACVQWYVATWRARVDDAKAGGGDTSERKRYDAARADRAELDLKERKGQLVEVRLVRRLLTDMSEVLTSGLDGLPARLAAELAVRDEPVEVQTRLEEEVHELRTAISAAVRDYTSARRGRRAPCAAAAANGSGVGRREADSPAG